MQNIITLKGPVKRLKVVLKEEESDNEEQSQTKTWRMGRNTEKGPDETTIFREQVELVDERGATACKIKLTIEICKGGALDVDNKSAALFQMLIKRRHPEVLSGRETRTIPSRDANGQLRI